MRTVFHRLLLRCLAGAALGLASSVVATAQDSRPLTLVIPFAAGGSSDAMARILAERLGTVLARSVVVEARAGGSGLIASRYVLQQPADGRTLLLTSPTVLIILPKITKIEFEPTDVFTPVSNIGANPFLLAINAGLPAKTLVDFIALARQRKGELNYASGGAGTSTHLVAALLFKTAGVELTHVPYRGGAPAVIDLLAGHVNAYFGNPVDFGGQASGGSIRILATSSDKRSADLPDVPTVAETYPGFRLVTWNGLVARTGTPADEINRISMAIQKISKEPNYIERMNTLGFDVLGNSPQEFGETIKRDRVLWDDAITSANISMQ